MSSTPCCSSGACPQGLHVDSSYIHLPKPALVRSTNSPLTQLNSGLDVSSLLSALSSLSSSSRVKRGGRRSKLKTEVSKTFGNDSPNPFFKAPSTRSQAFHSVEMIAPFNILSTNASLPTFVGISFTASSINDFSSFSVIFDQYCIREIEVSIEPQLSEVVVVAGDPGYLYSVVDLDDAVTPSSLTDLTSYSSVLVTRGTRGHYHRFKPTVALAAFSGAFTSYAAEEGMWLDCGSPNIQHYGIKCGNSAAPATQVYQMTVKFHISWRARH